MTTSVIWTLAAGDGSVALTTSLQGMLMIFAVLALLWGAVEIMRSVLIKKQQTKTTEIKKIPIKKSTPVAPPVVSAPQPTASSQTDADGALVAAITAAISAAMAEEGYTGGFRVVSFKRASANGRRGRF